MLEMTNSKLKSAVSRMFGVSLHTKSGSAHLGFSLIAGRNLPVYPCFKLKRAQIPHRAFILTIPKYGTYLIAKILENLGIVDCGVHIATDHLQDNRFADEKILRVEPGSYMVLIPLNYRRS